MSSDFQNPKDYNSHAPKDYDPDIRGQGLADSISQILELKDPRERIILEMAREADRLEVLIDNLHKPSCKAQTVTRRVQTLKVLNESINIRDEKRGIGKPVTIYAQALRSIREVMKEQAVPKELIETVLQGVLVKMQQREEEGEKDLIALD